MTTFQVELIPLRAEILCGAQQLSVPLPDVSFHELECYMIRARRRSPSRRVARQALKIITPNHWSAERRELLVVAVEIVEWNIAEKISSQPNIIEDKRDVSLCKQMRKVLILYREPPRTAPTLLGNFSGGLIN